MTSPVFQKSVLPNGVRVLSEAHPHAHSQTIGVWVEAGTVFETSQQAGMAHLLEHMVFKGTCELSTSQIANLVDSIGGQLNAFTDREFVCFHMKVLSEKAPVAVKLLCDLITCPLLKEADLELEKGVILEEIHGMEDTPEDLVEEMFQQKLWPRSRWSACILGNAASVRGATSDQLRQFMKQHYTPQRILVAASGNVDHEQLTAQVEKLLGHLRPAKNRRAALPAIPPVQAGTAALQRDTEQVHLCYGAPAFGCKDPRRFATWILETVLTGGFSSRLFQELREKQGLCYGIGAFSSAYRNAGFWGIETSTAPASAPKLAKLIGRELRRLKKHGITQTEWRRAVNMLRTNILLCDENPSSRMNRIARQELCHGRQFSSTEIIGKLEATSPEQVRELCYELFDPAKMNLAVVGPQLETPLEIDV
jgi:predicted Zn-dependent peptidase